MNLLEDGECVAFERLGAVEAMEAYVEDRKCAKCPGMRGSFLCIHVGVFVFSCHTLSPLLYISVRL